MLPNRKSARDFLLHTDRPTFLEVVYKAKVTPRQKDILYRKYLDNKSNIQIAEELFTSIETVRNELAVAHDHIYNYLFIT